MKQRSKKQTRVRLFAFALVKSREVAAKVAGGRTAKGKDTTVPQVLAEWIDGVAELRGASDDVTVLAIVERLRGKPLVVKEVVLIPEGIRGPNASVAEIDGKPLALPKGGAL